MVSRKDAKEIHIKLILYWDGLYYRANRRIRLG